MKRLTRFQENISVRKATNYAIIINSLEILLILGVIQESDELRHHHQ